MDIFLPTNEGVIWNNLYWTSGQPQMSGENVKKVSDWELGLPTLTERPMFQLQWWDRKFRWHASNACFEKCNSTKDYRRNRCKNGKNSKHIIMCLCTMVSLVPRSHLRSLMASRAKTKSTNHYTNMAKLMPRLLEVFQSNGWRIFNQASGIHMHWKIKSKMGLKNPILLCN